MTRPNEKRRPVEERGNSASRPRSDEQSDGVDDGKPENSKPGNRKKRGDAKGRSRLKGPKKRRGGTPPVYAALDLGTNNCRLLVARPSRRGFVVVDAFSRIIRLGEGVSKSGRLSDEAMQRTIAALHVCSKKMRKRGVKRSRLIATQACRIASNADAFIEQVRRETGLDLEIIDQETEARLAVSGCASLLEADTSGALVFDIGGGSSELIWLDMSGKSQASCNSLEERMAAQSHISCWTSLSVGVVTIAEKFGGHDVTPEIFEEMVVYVMDMLASFEKENGIAEQLQRGKRLSFGHVRHSDDTGRDISWAVQL